jgi:uncharacterized protein YdhG (YjbR/CyaY superfamily)
MQSKKNYQTVDEYICAFPQNIQTMLQDLRCAIKESAPHAAETISYQMPAFKQNGVLVYFGAFKKHIGFFPTRSGVAEFKEKLGKYKTNKGTIQFPLEEPFAY